MEIVIIGSGLAGCQVAWQLLQQEKHSITILCKGQPTNCNSQLAQGGIAVALAEKDHWEDHYFDTLLAGCQHNQKKLTKQLVKSGPDVVTALIQQGLSFDTKDDGNYDYGLEGAHGTRRILHCAGDQTGKYMLQFFQQKLQNIKWLEHAMVSQLLIKDNQCHGLIYLDAQQQKQQLTADAVILATGGVGNLYPLTTSDTTLTADGHALFLRAGGTLKDMEFIQFHPTLLAKNKQCYGLISEAVRGAGATLVNEDGQAIMAHHPQKDLAPRDVVARTISASYQNKQPVFLDISKIADFPEKFPQITANLRQQHIPFEQNKKIPVHPGAHFTMGGIPVNSSGQTSISCLYAVGEVAYTGVHGANRLASNSLLECLVFGNLVAQALATLSPRNNLTAHVSPISPPKNFHLPEKKALQDAAWHALGIERTQRNLTAFLQWLQKFDYQELPSAYTKEELSLANLCLCAEAIAKAALKRPHSLGAHSIQEEKDESYSA
ncbi:MAG: L-aspartate oxidase [Enterococcus sp.]